MGDVIPLLSFRLFPYLLIIVVQDYDDCCMPLVYLEKTYCIALLLVIVDFKWPTGPVVFTLALRGFPR